jgi:hypothetical protein
MHEDRDKEMMGGSPAMKAKGLISAGAYPSFCLTL